MSKKVTIVIDEYTLSVLNKIDGMLSRSIPIVVDSFMDAIDRQQLPDYLKDDDEYTTLYHAVSKLISRYNCMVDAGKVPDPELPRDEKGTYLDEDTIAQIRSISRSTSDAIRLLAIYASEMVDISDTPTKVKDNIRSIKPSIKSDVIAAPRKIKVMTREALEWIIGLPYRERLIKICTIRNTTY